MGFLDKIKFWRKGEDEFSDLGLGSDFGKGTTPGMPGPTPPGMPDMGPGSSPVQGGLPDMPTEEPMPSTGTPVGAGTPFGTVQSGQQPPAAAQHLQPSPPQKGAEHEIVIAKLDAIKAYLDSINQRLANLERTLRENEKRW